MGELEKSICQLPPPRPGVNPDIDRILLQALEKDPLRRYSSAEAFADDLNRYLNGYPVQARAGSFAYRSAKFVGRHRFGVVAAALFLLLVAGFSMGMALLARRASQQASIANQTTEFLLGLFAANDPAIGRGDKITARELLDKGAEQLDRMNKVNGADPVVQIRLLDNIASIYNSLGTSEKAKEMLEKSLRLRLARLPKDEVAEADTLARLADVETDLSHYDQALALNQRALAAYRNRFKDGDERIAIRLARISSDYWEQDKLPQSESYEREALALSTRLTARNDPRTLEMIGDLGTIVDLQGKMPEAQRYYDEFLAAEQTLVPRNLPNLGLAWNYEGWLHYRMGHFEQAEQEMRNALALRIEGYGPTHPVTAGAQSSLAYILLCRGKDSEALSLATQAKDTLEKLYGLTHRETTYAEDSLGLALLANGRADEARHEFQSAFQARQILLPPTHMQTGKTWMFLGQADFALGNLSLAAEESRKSLEILEHVYGPHGHPQVAEFDALHLQILAAQHRFKEGEEFGAQSLASFRKILPSDNWRLAAVESGLSLSLCQDGRLGQLGQGIALSREALAIDQASFGSTVAQTAQVAMRLNYCLQAAGQHDESGRLMRDYAAPLLTSRDPSYRIERGWLSHAKFATGFMPGLVTAK
jgi:serine/threonine-protein kinase